MQTGVYLITSKSTNKQYVGSSIDISKRFKQHKYCLKANKHHSSYLQNVYNKYGSDDLSYNIIETVDNIDALIEREQFYIDSLKPELNMSKIAGRPELNEEALTKQRLSQIGNNISTNSSGICGVYRRNKKWSARITIEKHSYYLGCFDNKELAINARTKAETEYKERGMLPSCDKKVNGCEKLPTGKYRSRLTINGIPYTLGICDSIEASNTLRQAALDKYNATGELPKRKSKHEYTGIRQLKNGKFKGRVVINGKEHTTKTFDSREEAAAARLELLKQTA